MKTISCLSAAGSTGTTTLASPLAAAVERRGFTTVLLDTALQGRLAAQARVRDSETPVLTPADTELLPHRRDAARENAVDLCLIDTQRNARAAASRTAARAAQRLLVPCRPALFDLASIGAPLEIARKADAPVTSVLKGVPPRGSFVREAQPPVLNEILHPHGSNWLWLFP